MAQPTIQERLVTIATEQNAIRKAEHPHIQSLETILLDPGLKLVLAALDKAATELVTPDTESLRVSARNAAEALRHATVVAARQRQLSEQALAAFNG